MRLITSTRRSGCSAPLAQRVARLATLACVGVVLAACSTAPPTAGPDSYSAPTKMGMRDLRAEFRRAFCARLSQQADCANVLLRLPGEPARAASTHFSTLPALARHYRLAFVPGLLAGCAGSLAMPFADVVETLRTTGFDARILSIDGRGSTQHNADLIAQQLTEAGEHPHPWIVFGYSKGLPDTLEALVQHPETGRNIAAVVSYAGAVGGSDLVGDAGGLPAALLEHVPLPGCAAGDGAALQSLRRDVRHAWWQAHHAALRPPFYAIVAAARPDRVSAPLRPSHASLSKVDALNDGQLLATDALVPGGALLGYVNADHWAVAMPLSRLPIIGGMFIDDVPRADLVLAAIEVIAEQTPRKP